MRSLEPFDRGQHERMGGSLKRTDPHGSAHCPALPGELGVERLEPRDQRRPALHEQAAGIRQLETTSVMPKKLDTRLALELRKLLGDRRGRVGETLGGLRDRAFTC